MLLPVFVGTNCTSAPQSDVSPFLKCSCIPKSFVDFLNKHGFVKCVDQPLSSVQPYGEEASWELKRLILGQEVAVEIRERDTYKREDCVIRKESMDLNLEMVNKGMGMHKVLEGPLCFGVY